MRFIPQLDRLERRDTPTTAFQSGNVLYVRGTEAADVITIDQDGGGNLSVSDVPGTFSGVTQIQVLGFGGDDLIEVTEAVTKKVTIIGGTGNDTLIGGSGNDLIYGSEGDDAMYGRGGTDYLNGFTGNDFFDGGAGFDTAADDDDGGGMFVNCERFFFFDY